MQEKFDKWCKLKKEIHFGRKQKFYIKQREIWYVNIGMNIGYETYGKGNDFIRPALVIKRIGNMFLVIPMTTKGNKNFFKYRLNEQYFGKKSFLLISQGKFIDHKRFLRKIKVINKKDFEEIKKRLITSWL